MKFDYSKPEAAFLSLYRDLEDACREFGGCQVADIEKNMESQGRPADSSKLRMCRMARNFLVHDGPGFASVTPAMSRFLDMALKEVRASKGTAKDVMTAASRYGTVLATDTVGKASEAITARKHGDVLVTDSDGMLLGVLGGAGLAQAFCLKGKAMKACDVCSLAGITTVRADTPVSEIPDRRCAVLRENGKLAGVANPGKAWCP